MDNGRHARVLVPRSPWPSSERSRPTMANAAHTRHSDVTGSLLRAWVWLSPCVVIAAAASLGGALVEGVMFASTAGVALVGVGESVGLVCPAVVVALALARGLWLGWRPLVVDRRRGPEI